MRMESEGLYADANARPKVKSLDFLVIGAAKSGTTSLFYYLKFHPKIYMPSDKEAPFFCKDEWFKRGWEQFAGRYFPNAPLDLLWGKISPRYMADPRAPERIFRQMPGVKLIALLRNPIDRVLSDYRMFVNRSRSSLPVFKDFIASQIHEEDMVRSRNQPPDNIECLHKNSALKQGEYGRILKGFLRYFPREQLLIIFSDDLEHNPQSILDQVLAHIGLEPGFSPPNIGKRYNVGGTKLRFRNLRSTVRKIYPLKLLWRMLPENRRGVIKLWFNTQVKTVQEAPQELPQELRTLLVDFYRDDVRKLEELIDTRVPWEEFHSLTPV